MGIGGRGWGWLASRRGDLTSLSSRLRLGRHVGRGRGGRADKEQGAGTKRTEYETRSNSDKCHSNG